MIRAYQAIQQPIAFIWLINHDEVTRARDRLDAYTLSIPLNRRFAVKGIVCGHDPHFDWALI